MTHVDVLVKNAREAAREFMELGQPEVDRIVAAMARAGAADARRLAEIAVEETGIGNVEDKVVKNCFGTQVVHDYMSGLPSVGIIGDEDGILVVAEPFGVIVAVTPTTNPTSTTMFKSLIALKGRNVVVFAFHPRAQKCSVAAAEVMRSAAVSAGAPPNCVQWVTEPSVEATGALMKHPDVAMVIATGGSSMVKAAYSSGHPALGVGPGNAPVYVERTADLEMAVRDIIVSKTFDNGTICSSDQTVIFDDPMVAGRALELFAAQGAHIASRDEKVKLEAVMFDKERGVPSAAVVGKSPVTIAELAGFSVPVSTRLILVPLTTTGAEDWMSHEKLSPVLGWFVARDRQEAIAAATGQLVFCGAGHSAVIFSEDEQAAHEFALRVPASRVLWNQPSVHGAIGALYNNLVPSLTLGCGSRGGNITSENVGFKNLLNIKRVVRRTTERPVSQVPGGKALTAGNVATAA
jgi:acyl-CoA reductase-like NAD-dependent aldehyde dehydrogenase